MELLAAVIVAMAVGAIVAWLAAARRWEGKVREAEVRMEERERGFSEQKALLESSERKLADTFKSLAADALEAANHSFLTLADQKLGSVVGPVNESLGKLDREIREIEGARRQAYGALGEQISSLITAQKELRSEASNLSRALRAPSVRGRWGEIQLNGWSKWPECWSAAIFSNRTARPATTASCAPTCACSCPAPRTSSSTPRFRCRPTSKRSKRRPRKRARKSSKRRAASARAHDCARLQELLGPVSAHARVRDPVLPGEPFFSAALEQDPSLIEQGVAQRVILATPTTLISLLRAVSYGWRQEQLAENAQRISEMARELADRFATMVEHLRRVGTSLKSSVGAFNDAVGLFEGRVMPWARRFRELGVVGKKELGELEKIDLVPREPATALEERPETAAAK